MHSTGYVLMITFRVACCEIALSGVNYFILMQRVYEPRVGVLVAHRIGMSTRIAYIPVFAYGIPYFAETHRASQLLLAGVFWLAMILVFEWGGSAILRRPVREILEGWHVERGFMWPYVLVAYLLSPLVVGEVSRLWQ